jgi:glycosyl transferase family 87
MLGAVIFLALGLILLSGSDTRASDFRFVYNGVRCLLRDVDPYQRNNFIRVFEADGGDLGSGTSRLQHLEMAQHMYLPTSAILAPLALLPWNIALVVWTMLIAAGFILASYLAWDWGARNSPVLAGILVFSILGSSELLIVTGNAVGVVVPLAVIAVWCFVENRFVPAGIFCMAISLLLKPHDVGLVWLYFLLAGTAYRRRAVQTLVATLAMGVPTILWTSLVAPHWVPELRSNLVALSSPGHLNDPGPTSMSGHGIGMVTDLQSVISLVKNDPRIYDPVSYLIFAFLFLPWIVVTLRAQPSKTLALYAITAISAMSMLPSYHRVGDAKLLLISIPACTALWVNGGVLRWLSLVITSAGILLTGEFQWAILFAVIKNSRFSARVLDAHTLVALQVIPVPVILLIVTIFYLYVYFKFASRSENRKNAISAQ